MNKLTPPTTTHRGGARKGAGRPPGKTRIRLVFMIPITTATTLKTIPFGKRSKFVASAIEKAFEKRRHA